MNFNDYQQSVSHRFESEFSPVDALMVAVSGILIELDEVGRATTATNKHEELGDTLFYIAYSKDLIKIDNFYDFEQSVIELDDLYSELLQALGFIHKDKRRGNGLSGQWQIAYAISMAYCWVTQQGVDMQSLYAANIKKVSAL